MNKKDIGIADHTSQTLLGEGNHAPIILVVEDERDLARVIKGALKTRGFDVLLSHDGNAAIDLYRGRSQEISLILSDVVMPSMKGPELLGKLKSLDASARIVFMSGQAREDALPGIPVDAFSGWLQKPFSLKDLVAAIDTALADGKSG